MGPGGGAAAGDLAEASLSVVGIEGQLAGGECPYYVCIPSKMMIRAANALAEGRRMRGLAGEVDVSPNWAPVAERIRSEATDHWDDTVAVDRFLGNFPQAFSHIGLVDAARAIGTAEDNDRPHAAGAGDAL